MPETGSVNFRYKNGVRISCDYTCYYDEKGQMTAIIGQHQQLNQRIMNEMPSRQTFNERVRLTDSLLSAYDTIIQIDLEDFSFKVIHATQAVMAASQQVDNVLKLGALFRDYYIAPEYHEAFNQFIDPTTLADRIYGCKSISCEYMTSNIGWSHARIVPSEINSQGKVMQAIFTTESCNARPTDITPIDSDTSLDGLTGLLTRTTGKKVATEELKKKKGGLFLIFDCDYFRAINSMLGQAIGDLVLIEESRVLYQFFPNSVIMRSGGDEFAICTAHPDLVAEGAENVYNRLAQEIKNINIPEMSGVTQSLSAGIVTLEAGKPYDFDVIFTQAHECLKEAKKMGGGHCVIHNA